MNKNRTFCLAASGLWAVLALGPIWAQDPSTVNNGTEEVKERQRQLDERCNSPYADMTGIAYQDCYGFRPNPPPRQADILPPQAPTPEKNNTPKKPSKRNPVWRFFARFGGA